MLNLNRFLLDNRWRFGITFILCIAYSLFRDSGYSTMIKPLPIIYWLLVALASEKRNGGKWLLISLSFAILGDILLDLGDQWLKIGSLPFLISTSLLAVAFGQRLKNQYRKPSIRQLIYIYSSVFGLFFMLFIWISSYSASAVVVGAILYLISAFLIATSISNHLLNRSEPKYPPNTLIGFVGTCGIVANYILYSIDLFVAPVPRDLVIQVYYWGTAMVVWSFLISSWSTE